MNKTFKKALAAILAVLMVAFSVPFTALAAEPVDTGAKIHVYATTFDQKNGYLGASAQSFDNQAVKFYDLKNMSVDEVMADAAYSRDKGVATFALVFTVEGTNIDRFSWIADYDGTAIQPAYWRTNAAVNTWTDGTTYASKSAENLYTDGMLDVMGTTSKFEEDNELIDAMYLSVVDEGYTCAASTDLLDEEENVIGQIQGELVAVLGFELKKDCDLTQVIKTRMTSDVTLVDIAGHVDAVYGGRDWMTGEKTEGYFSIPELGLAPSGDPQPTKDTYTYTFDDGSQQTVEVDAGAQPTAPANTETVTEHVADTETHKVTTYSWVADGDKAFKEQANATTTACDFKETSKAVDPVHTADGTLTDGKTAVEKCTVCGFEKGGEVVKATHSYVMTHVDATCLVKAHDHYVCSVCGDAYDDNFTGELADHKWVQTGSSAADCQTPGTIDYECEVCHKTKTETGAYGAHKLTAHEAVAADCVNGGNDAYWTCDVCNKMFADAEGATEITEIPATPAKGHTLTAHEAVPATCTEGGNDAYWTCDVCGKMFSDAEGTTEITEIPATPAKGHTWVNEEAIPADRANEGREAGRYCTECDAREGYAVIPALGVDITVSGSSLGTATVNGEAVANAVKNVPYAQNYTLVATANAGAKFVGWKVADKLVSTEETYTTAAFADMTYVPVFVEDTTDAFEITFVDAYDNVVTTVSSADLPLSELPAAPQFAGVTFDAWSLDLDAVNALTKAEKVVATYKNVEDKVYTVTAPEGCTITVNGEAVASPAAAAYNDTVTVTSAGAQGWSVNGSTEAAAYGETYTFYCGSDITVAPIAAVDAVPTVKAVSDNATGYQVKFLATRSVPEGYTLIESGFVYGKGMTADDLKLENVGKVAGSANGVVKQAVCQNKAADGQFALTYGVKNMDATACAVAYAICSGANGTVVYYSGAMVHPY